MRQLAVRKRSARAICRAAQLEPDSGFAVEYSYVVVSHGAIPGNDRAVAVHKRRQF
jgi:hypothetical protein